MSENTRITAVAFLKNEKEVAISAKTPKNVINDDYFTYCCQYHALNIQCKVAESEMVKVQFEKLEKLSDNNEEALKIHKEHMDKAQAYVDACTELRDNFIIQIPETLLSVFESDNFAKAYTYRLMGVKSFSIAESTTKGVKLKRVPAEIYDSSKYTESIKGANWKLSNAITTLFDKATPKAIKQEIFKPFISILNEMFSVDKINKSVYRLPNFNQITNAIWSKYAQTIMSGNNSISSGVGYGLNNDDVTLISLQTAAMTHLHVVESAENNESKKTKELSTWAKEFTESLEKTKEKVSENKEEKSDTE